MLLDWIARRQMAAFEKTFGYDMAYGRELLGWSRKGFWRFARLAGMASYREGVPLSTWYAVKLVGLRAEDCGPCTQLVVDMASREGVAAELLKRFGPRPWPRWPSCRCAMPVPSCRKPPPAFASTACKAPASAASSTSACGCPSRWSTRRRTTAPIPRRSTSTRKTCRSPSCWRSNG